MKTTSLQLSKQLKEAGFPQENSTFKYWFSNGYALSFVTGNFIRRFDEPDYFTTVGHKPEEYMAAPTAEEILERLPVGTKIRKQPGFYSVSYAWSEEKGQYEKFTHEDLCYCLATLWLYLNKRNLLSSQ